MLPKLGWRLLCPFILLLSLALQVSAPLTREIALAQPVEGNSVAEQYVERVRSVTFSTMPPANAPGRVDIPDLGAIQWSAGQTPDEYLRLGTFYDSFNLQLLSFESVANWSGIDTASLTLADINLFSDQNLQGLVSAIPELGKWQVYQLPIFQDLLSGVYSDNTPWDEFTLEQIVNQEGKGDLALNRLDLSQYGLDAIPGLLQAPLARLDGWEQTFINQIPGLRDVPFAAFPGAPFGTGYVALFDVPYGKKEAQRLNTITGSYEEGFEVPCAQDSCSYIELSGPTSLNAKPLHGKQWIKGGTESDAQMVKGGSGILGMLNNGMEPTGRHPYGRGFKVVLRETNESRGEAKFAIYFRYCKDLAGCSPYIIGPIPWFSNHEDDIIFVGLTQAVQEPPNVPDHPGLPPGTEIPNYPPPTTTPDTSNLGNDDCTNYKGVSIGGLKQAIATIESYGGNYAAVGDYACTKGEGNILCGRALGKYQFMTYNEYASNRIRSHPGGAEFLNRAADPTSDKAAISQELLKYFPPEEQEAAFSAWTRSLIDKAAAEGRTGDELIARFGEMHNAGPSGRSPDYGRRTVEEYKIKQPSLKALCEQKGACTGQLSHPAPGYPITSPFGWRVHPITKDRRLHQGIDYGTPLGTSIIAADGGQVVHAGWMSGYGQTVDIKHCDGRLTRYGHLSAILISNGAVSPQQVVGRAGTTGNSTGPHLHFEVHVNGTAVDPQTQIGR